MNKFKNYILKLSKVRSGLKNFIIGQEEATDTVSAALFTVGQRDFAEDGKRVLGCSHVCLSGFAGSGKTVLAKSLALLIDGKHSRVTGTNDSLSSDITGYDLILLDSSKHVVHGPAFGANILLADEINRFSAKTQNAFLEILAEGQVSIGGKTYQLEKPFLCIATQNPSESLGVSPLQEAISDRFVFKILMRETTDNEKIEIARRTKNFDFKELQPVITVNEINEAREHFFDKIYVSDHVRRYCAKILRVINHPEDFSLFSDEISSLEGENLFKQKTPVNDRSLLHLEAGGMSQCLLNDRDYVLPSDIYQSAKSVLRGRLILSNGSAAVLLSEHREKYTTEAELIDYMITQVLKIV